MADPSNGTTAKNAALSSIPGGACVRLVGIDAGQGMAGRLAALGLLPGVQLLVITNPGTGPAIVEVVYLGVVPCFRRRGVGMAMLQRAAGAARSRGKAVMSLAVDSRNTAALRLYDAAGFSEVFRRLVYIRRP